MALDARLLAIVQAIGADIKALITRTTPFVGRTAAVQTVTSTTLANVTGLVAPVAANTLYRVTGRVVFQTSGLAVGVTIGVTSPAAANAQLVIAIPSTALISTGTATVRTNGGTGSGSTTGVVASGTNMVATIDGIVSVGATSGNFALQVAASGIGTVTVQPGSTLVVERLA